MLLGRGYINAVQVIQKLPFAGTGTTAGYAQNYQTSICTSSAHVQAAPVSFLDPPHAHCQCIFTEKSVAHHCLGKEVGRRNCGLHSIF